MIPNPYLRRMHRLATIAQDSSALFQTRKHAFPVPGTGKLGWRRLIRLPHVSVK